MFEGLFGKKKKDKGFSIKPGGSIEGAIGIPLNAFPKEVRKLLKYPVKNRDEIIRILGEDGIFIILNIGYKDEEGKDYQQKWKVNIITGEAEEIGGDGMLRMRSAGIKLR